MAAGRQKHHKHLPAKIHQTQDPSPPDIRRRKQGSQIRTASSPLPKAETTACQSRAHQATLRFAFARQETRECPAATEE